MRGRHATIDMTDIAVTSSTQLYMRNVGETAETKVGGWHSGVVVSSVASQREGSELLRVCPVMDWRPVQGLYTYKY